MTEKKAVKISNGNTNLQDFIIDRLKLLLPPRTGLAEEIADILNVSIDSAYRRIRGETEMTANEVFKIASKHALSLDEIFNNRSDMVTFAYIKLTDSASNFETYLKRIRDNIIAINKFGNKKIYYVAEETPLFYSFFSKKLTDFKLFYWQRSVLNIPLYQNVNFEYGIVPQHLVDIAHEASQEYHKVPSVEIWSDETVFTGLKQIRFYFDSGILSKTLALELLDDYKKMILYVQKNAENERKNISDVEVTYTLYKSEVILGTNCIYTVLGDSKYSYISFNTLNSLTTNNKEFCDETEHWIKNLTKKSSLISGIAEKERYKFFNSMLINVDKYIERIAQE